MSSPPLRHLLAAGLSIFASGLLSAQSIIDVTFPDGTGTNALFEEIDNGLGGGTGTWTQATGVLYSTTANNSTTGAASRETIDFTTLGSDSLTLTVEATSRTGTNVANGMFIGFQQRNSGGAGTDLWNNNPPSFGLLIPGTASGGLVQDRVSVGGNGGNDRYQVAPGYGVVTAASLGDGFTMTLTVSSTGWELSLTGLQDGSGTAITGELGRILFFGRFWWPLLSKFLPAWLKGKNLKGASAKSL